MVWKILLELFLETGDSKILQNVWHSIEQLVIWRPEICSSAESNDLACWKSSVVVMNLWSRKHIADALFWSRLLFKRFCRLLHEPNNFTLSINIQFESSHFYTVGDDVYCINRGDRLWREIIMYLLQRTHRHKSDAASTKYISPGRISNWRLSLQNLHELRSPRRDMKSVRIKKAAET